ncbi:MAG: alcohol dehydrogenase catalytic domain-containing protein [Desulfobacterales bacterium]|nr:alcohol dehydrogenase catalytic domain-containing protein [Desulfobacterales bacterium]
MSAVVFDEKLCFVTDHPRPGIRPGWARIHVRMAGICKTDMEIVKGYMGFKGVLGHEFVGDVEDCEDAAWIGKRVVGEINATCGRCDWCAEGMGRHCPHRQVLGILGLDGCMAEYCVLPVSNLLEVPPGIPDDRAALIEPLSAACAILERTPVKGTEKTVVLGDGKLGILCAWVLATRLRDVTLVGHHPEKLERARWGHLNTALGVENTGKKADIVVDATGSARGLPEAVSLCKSRGTIVLKTTVAAHAPVNLSQLVVDEITIRGSRCGRFSDGLEMLASHPDMPLERLISSRRPLSEAPEAFAAAAEPGSLKVLLTTRS